MTADMVLTAQSVITMEPSNPRAEAVAVDSSTGAIVAVGTLAECQAAAPGVAVTDLGDTVLMPGFIEAHSHPAVSGLATEPPAHWISRAQGYATYADVQALWRQLDSSLPDGEGVMCWGLDRMGQGAPELLNTDLDVFFPNRPAAIFDISGHEAYFNSATIALNGWPGGKPPADPPASRFGRNADGTSNGRAYETGAVSLATNALSAKVITDPLKSVASWFRTLAQAGVTTTSDMAYSPSLLPAYEAVASSPHSPVRVGVYHVATDPACTQPLNSTVPAERLWKAGTKLWADGTTFIGTLAASFPFLENDTTKNANVLIGPSAESVMNYTRAQLDAALEPIAASGLQPAIHAHGDVAIDIVLDAYASVLSRHGLLDTDHRWRIEHWSAGRADQFRRAVDLGVATTLATYQFVQLGDLLDGTLFPSEIGARWVAAADAIKSGAKVSFHSDSPVSPVDPIQTIQCMVTRRTPSGELHAPDQSISMDDALRAYTINAAYHLRREQDLGSIAVGKLADFVQLSADPYDVDPLQLTDQVNVLATWSGGVKVDTDAFMSDMAAVDPAGHASLTGHVATHTCC
jgi:predicted amidohydrolase YtcJ